MSALQEIAIDIDADLTANGVDEGHKHQGPLGSLLNRFHRLSIGRKITLFFGLNLGFALLAGLFVVLAFINISDQSKQTAETHRGAFIAERLVAELSQTQRMSENLATAGDEARTLTVLVQLDQSLASLDKLGSLDTLGSRAQTSDTAYSQTITSITGAVVDFKTQIENAATFENAKLDDQAIEEARDLAQRLGQDANSSAAAGYDMITTMLFFWIALSGVLVLLTLVAQRYFDNHVGAALSSLASQMSRLSTGEQIANIEASNRRDEIGEMTRAMMVFHKAGMRLERLASERSRKAQENLEKQAALQEQREEARRDRERTLRKIADNFERKVGDVVSQVASATSQLQCTATTMAASADQASTRTSEVTESMQEANAGATAAAAASDEFAMSITEVSNQAAASAQLARKANVATQEADATLSKLSQSADQVGNIVELIQTIAQRTNLLALNASIEAARGGEAGRGFAVVASEVKELAMQTSRATEEVALLIRAIQDTSGESVGALRSIANEVAELESVAVTIAGAVDQQSYAGQDLARSIDMAARGTQRVAEHIKEVRELSTTTGDCAGQVLSNATALEDQAATLRTQVNRFLEEVRAA